MGGATSTILCVALLVAWTVVPVASETGPAGDATATAGEPVTRTVRVETAGLPLSADETVLVRARADAPETNVTDNLAAVTVPSSVVDPVIVPPTPANDPDDDGLYEDVNGDGRVGFIDVVDLLFADFAAIDDDPDRRAAVDFDGDGSVGFLDVVTLLFEL